MNFEIVASKADLMQELNAQLQNIPSSQLVFEVKGAKVQLLELKLVNIRLSIDKLYASIVVKIEVLKKTLLSDVKADGMIEIDSVIDFKISKDWQLNTIFHYTGHKWIESPDLNLGLIQFPVQSIVDGIIIKQQKEIEDSLNQQLEAISDLSRYMKTILPYVNQSFNMQTTTFQIIPQIEEIWIKEVTDTAKTIKILCSLEAEPSFRITSTTTEEQSLPSIIIQNTM